MITFKPGSKNGLILILALTVMGIVGGCEALFDRISDNDRSTRLVVTYATLKYIEAEDTEQAKMARAQRIHEVSSEALEYLDSDVAVTIAALQGYIESRIDWSQLDAADTLLARGLLEILAEELTARVPPDATGSERVVVARWVIEVVQQTVAPFAA